MSQALRLRPLLAGVAMMVATSLTAQTVPATLSEALRAHIKTDRFDVVSSIRGLPIGVRDGLQKLFGSQAFDIAVDIAEPGARFQESDLMSNLKLPIRRLGLAECSIDHCLVYYERGGRAHTWHVALFHWTPDATRFEWGGGAPSGLAAIRDVRNAMLSGSIKGVAKVW